jgi:hypothetical protein
MKKAINLRNASAYAGMIAPVLFVMVYTIEGLLRPGYHARSMFISALSLGPRGWIQIVNFLVFGALLFVFSRGVAAEVQDGKAYRGWILLTVLSVFYFLSGLFVMDPTGTPLEQATLHGTVHGILGGIVFLLMPITCFVYLRRFREDPEWQSIQGWTLALGTLSALGVILMTVTSKIPVLVETFASWQGLIQRAAITPFMFWIFVFSLGFLEDDE